MSMEDGACAGCGKPLGPRINWHVPPGQDGRAYHNDCEPSEPEPEKPRPKETLTEFVERKARDAMHGRGQGTLEEDACE